MVTRAVGRAAIPASRGRKGHFEGLSRTKASWPPAAPCHTSHCHQSLGLKLSPLPCPVAQGWVGHSVLAQDPVCPGWTAHACSSPVALCRGTGGVGTGDLLYSASPRSAPHLSTSVLGLSLNFSSLLSHWQGCFVEKRGRKITSGLNIHRHLLSRSVCFGCWICRGRGGWCFLGSAWE